MNLLDYINWRGDLTLKQDPFNEIDNAILSRVSYMPLEAALKENEVLTISATSKIILKQDLTELKILNSKDIPLLKALSKSQRYKNMILTNYVNKLNQKEEKQFAAVTILLPDKTIYISYRGTDNTFTGWKEDLNMAYQKEIPSQKEALSYLEKIARVYHNKIRIGGHSKGGNIAIYAAIFCNKKIQKRIINIYSNEGPGFTEEMLSNELYNKMEPKITTYIPQESIIGKLLNRKEEEIIVKSTNKGIYQHDIYSWQVEQNHFIYEKETNKMSKQVEKVLKTWLEKTTIKERKEFVNTLYKILISSKAKNVDELGLSSLKNAFKIISTYSNIDEESKKATIKLLEKFFSITKESIMATIKKTSLKNQKKNKI